MEFKDFVTLCLIISGLLSGIDFFVSKEKIKEVDNKIKVLLSSGVEKLTDLFARVGDRIVLIWEYALENPLYLGRIFLILLILRGLVSWLDIFPESVMKLLLSSRMALALLLFAVAFAIVGAILLVPIRCIVRFLCWSPKGVIGAISFPLFIITTAYKFYELIYK